MIVPVATALPRDDIDSVDAIVILPYREPALRMRRADRGRAHEHGGEPRISCWHHLAVLPLDAIHPSSAIRQALLRARLPEHPLPPKAQKNDHHVGWGGRIRTSAWRSMGAFDEVLHAVVTHDARPSSHFR